MTMTLKKPPLIKNNLSPVEIIGYQNMEMFKAFYKIVTDARGFDYPTAKLKKEIGKDQLKWIAATLEDLRERGLYPCGYHKDGSIRWMMPLKGEFQQTFEGPELAALEKLSVKELQDRARRGYSQIVDNVTLQP